MEKEYRRWRRSEKRNMPGNESNALENWDKWMGERKEMYSRFSRKLGVSPRYLLMNTSEFGHRKTLHRQVLERAREPLKFDKYRGPPDFWLMEEGIREQVIPRRTFKTPEEPDAVIIEETKLPMIAASRRKKKFDYKNPEYSGTPRNILEEKGLQEEIYSSQTQSQRKTEDEHWMENAYLHEKAKKLPPQLKRIIYNKPDIENLYIAGRYMRIEEREEEDKSSNGSKASIVPGRESGTYEDGAGGNINDEKFESLIINGKMMPLRISDDEETIDDQEMSDLGKRIEIAFEGQQKMKLMQTLTIENISSKKVCYGWYRQEDVIAFNANLNLPMSEKEKSQAEKISNIIETIRPQFHAYPKFFFNKLKGVLHPTEEVNIRIFFCSKEDGLFSENWILYTDPPIKGTNKIGEIKVSLVGLVPIEAEENRTNPIELEIELRCAELMTKRNLMKVIETVVKPKEQHGDGPAGPALLLSNPKSDIEQRDVFNEKDIFRWANPPQYHYHPSIIKNLKCLHLEITKKYSKETDWNLSINHLREIIVTMKNGEVKSRYLKIFCNNADVLLEPYMEDTDDEKRYYLVYSLLCRFIDTLESQIKSLRINYGFPAPLKPKLEQAKQRTRAVSFAASSTLTSTSREMEDNGTKAPSTTVLPKRSYRQAVYVKIYGLLMRTVDSISLCLETTKNKYTVDNNWEDFSRQKL